MTNSFLEEIATAVSVKFLVNIDDFMLGPFASCDGLGIKIEIETHKEGGYNTAAWQLPGRISYPNVKLSRPLGPLSKLTQQWFTKVAQGYRPNTAHVVAMNTFGLPIAEWSLDGVVPVSWSGPQMSPDQPKVLSETVEIAHHGFLPI